MEILDLNLRKSYLNSIDNSDLNKIPLDVILLIFHELSFIDLQKSQLVSQKWKRITYMPCLGLRIWQDLVKKITPKQLTCDTSHDRHYILNIFFNFYRIKFPNQGSQSLIVIKEEVKESKMMSLRKNVTEGNISTSTISSFYQMPVLSHPIDADILVMETYQFKTKFPYGIYIKVGVLIQIKNLSLTDLQKKIIKDAELFVNNLIKKNQEINFISY